MGRRSASARRVGRFAGGDEPHYLTTATTGCFFDHHFYLGGILDVKVKRLRGRGRILRAQGCGEGVMQGVVAGDGIGDGVKLQGQGIALFCRVFNVKGV